MKTALYRKWRPKTFSDIVSQDAVCAALKNQVANDRCSHAYIFTGVRGTGKTSLAKILAKAVNCINPRDGEPCGECFVCRGIDDGSILDVSEIDAASNNGVDNIRDLRDETAFAPTVCKMRVYIIDEVHMLSQGAFNALLKTLEEPPSHVMFILATTEIHKVPATILSRCQRFDLKRIPENKIAERIEYVAAQESIALEPAAAELIARLSDGAMRDALSLLDTASSLCERVDEAAVARIAGVADKGYLFELAKAIDARDAQAILNKTRELHESSIEPTRLVLELSRHTRNLLMIKVSGEAALNDCSSEDVERYKKQSAESTSARLLETLDALSDCADKLSAAPDRMLALELCFLNLCGAPKTPIMKAAESAAAVPVSASVEEKKTSAAPEPDRGKAPAADASSKDRAPWEAEKPAEPPAPSKQSVPVPPEKGEFARWPEVLERIKGESPMLYAFLANSKAYLTDTHLLIDANEKFIAHIRENVDLKELIKNAVSEVAGIKVPIGPYKRKESESAGPDPVDDLISRARNSGVEVEVK